jgi:uncharacterized protein (DUF1800 family)
MRISRARRWNYHTLGVRSGYSQADVTNFAKVLTGWTWMRPEEPVHGGEFVFVRRFHEPGDQVVLGKRYTEGGLDQGRAVLADLARHPATAQVIGEKLARHFVADDPPPALVDKLAKAFLDTDGDLKQVVRTLGRPRSRGPRRDKSLNRRRNGSLASFVSPEPGWTFRSAAS